MAGFSLEPPADVLTFDPMMDRNALGVESPLYLGVEPRKNWRPTSVGIHKQIQTKTDGLDEKTSMTP